MEAADLLTYIQLAQLATVSVQLKSVENVHKIMAAISPLDFGPFFDIVSPTIQVQNNNLCTIGLPVTKLYFPLNDLCWCDSLLLKTM